MTGAAGRSGFALSLALVALVAAGPTLAAEGATCRLPQRISPAPEERAPPSEVERGVRTAYYLLSLSWSPEFCRGRAASDPDNALQCRQNSFGFVVHGLWPNGAGGRHPRFCGAAPPLDVATVRRHLCMTPSAELLQHEWAAHGTCGWPSPAAYFDRAASLWGALRQPDLRPVMTAGEIRDAFVRANPALPRRAVQVRVKSGNRLQEVGLCYSLAFRPAACPSPGAPDRVQIRIAPRR